MTEQEGGGGGGGGGFTPLTPIGGPSLEQEERAMRSGRGRMLFFMIAAVLAAIGGLVWFVTNQTPSEYSTVGMQINGMRRDNFDAFWGCALPRADLDEIRNNVQLSEAITERARGNPRAYAQHVRTECLVMLDEHVAPLNALIVPADMTEDVEDLRTAITSLRTSWNRFLDHLDHLETPYDAEDATIADMLTAIGAGWHAYKTAHQALNATIRQHLED
jgi:hypothetical protein